jgi:hypothetical protein
MSDLLNILVASTGLMPGDVLKIIADAPRRYKIFEIPKRSGGMREIAQPARELKILQRVLLDKILVKLPLHSASCAYRKSVSIRHNALVHAGSAAILKMDFQNFFPSITSIDWKKYCDRNMSFSQIDLDFSSRILFRSIPGTQHLRLSIGAPSSPTLSNVLMYDFDEGISNKAAALRLNYTRYADDLTFSGDDVRSLRLMARTVDDYARNLKTPLLSVNHAKTALINRANRRTVTGLVLANNGSVGLGRDRRRLVSAQVHHAILGKMSVEQMVRLAGYLAFVNVADPTFLEVLERKYGEVGMYKVRRTARLSYTQAPSLKN